MPLLNAVDGLPVHPGQLRQLLLGEVHMKASGTDLIADHPAAGNDPVGRRGWRHPTTLSGS